MSDNKKENYLSKAKEYYKIEKCRKCECLQGFLIQLKLDSKAELKNKIQEMEASNSEIHKCLNCTPCRPAKLFSNYNRNDSNEK